MPSPSEFRSANPRRRDRTARQRAVASSQARRLQDQRASSDVVSAVLERRRGSDAAPLERRPGKTGGGEVIVLQGELLARAAQLDATARGLIEAAHFSVEEVQALRGYVVRLAFQGERSDVAAMNAAVDQLRARLADGGVPTSLIYVTPCRINMKAAATPEDAGTPPATEVFEVPEGAVRVVVLDTGITGEQRQDGWLQGLLTTDNRDPLNVLPQPNPDEFLDLAAGHGTFAAGIVQQVAPRADLRVHRVLDTDGVADELQVAVALVAAVEAHLDERTRLVLNLSLGTETEDDQPPLALEAALDVVDDLQAERQGEVMVVAAAGNEGHDRPCWPGAFDRVVAVAALDESLQPAAWSSRGPWVDCSAVGEAVLSTFVEGTESAVLDPEPETFGPDAWALWTGTSFTAPQVAGAVAANAQDEDSSLRDALLRLLAGHARLAGYGRPVRILP